MMESLDYVISILSSNQLFLPNLDVNKDAMDSDVQKWLKAMMTNTQGDVPLGRGGEVVMSQTDLSQGCGLGNCVLEEACIPVELIDVYVSDIWTLLPSPYWRKF